jgi:hypothetical protein
MIDWSHYITPLLDLNMHDSIYDKVYKMTQTDDSVANKFTIEYVPLYESLPLKKMILVYDRSKDDLRTMYAVYNKVGFWKDIERQVTYSKDDVLQVQEIVNPLLGSAKSTVRKLIFAKQGGADEPAAILQK